MNSDDDKPINPTAKNGFSDIQTVSLEEYQQAINRLSEQIRQMVKPMAEAQGAIKKSLEPMVEISQAMAKVVKSHNEQMRQFSVPLRELLLSFSEQGWISGDTTVRSRVISESQHKTSIAIEKTTITESHQQSQTVKAELVGESKDKLDKILELVNQPRELSLEELEKILFDKYGKKTRTVDIRVIKRQKSNLVINGDVIEFIGGTRQDALLSVFFNNDNPNKEGFDVYGIAEAIGDNNHTKELLKIAGEKYYQICRAINDKIQKKTGIADFIIFDDKFSCWQINPEYLT